MISLISVAKAKKMTADNMRELRLEKGLSQSGLANRSGVSVASLRKFEQKGLISLESFFKLSMALGCLESIVDATKPKEERFSSIDEVLKKKETKKPRRGYLK